MFSLFISTFRQRKVRGNRLKRIRYDKVVEPKKATLSENARTYNCSVWSNVSSNPAKKVTQYCRRPHQAATMLGKSRRL